MRSAAELRQRWLETVSNMIMRPGMYASSGHQFDAMARTLLGDLCFLDDRDQDLKAVETVLHSFGKLGVAGPFIALFGEECTCVAEVASVFAEQFHRLGYLSLSRLLAGDEWDQLTAGLRERVDGKDVRRGEVEASFGQPSLLVDRRILCYAPVASSGWVFIDCFPEDQTVYVPGAGRHEWRRDDDPLVRTVRHPAADFESGLILTAYGRAVRVTTDSWIHHPEGLSDVQKAIAAQLRAVESRDPSQSLRRRRSG